MSFDTVSNCCPDCGEPMGAADEIQRLEGALREIANAANYTAPEDIEARLHNEVKVYAIAREALNKEGT